MLVSTRIIGSLAVALPLVLLGGCATENFNAQTYQTGLAAQRVEIGRVVAIRQVALQPNNAGGAIGTVAGGLIGSQLGGDSDSTVIHGLGLLGGAVLGGMLGQSIGNRVTGGVGELITVRLRSGRLIAVTETGAQGVYVGERVEVLFSPDGNVRVLPY